MSKYNPHHQVEPIYNAANSWRERSLIGDHSVLFEGKNLWTDTLLNELDKRFVKNPGTDEGNFLSKLKVQLSGGSSGCQLLMAECLWLLLLFPSNVKAATKRDNILEIWSWSGEVPNETHALLADDVLEGIGSAGTAYNTYRWRELAFLIRALRKFKKLKADKRKHIALDPLAFSGWLSSLQFPSRLSKFLNAQRRQLIHILPHLLFPDTFERISSAGDKRLILAGFGDTSEKEIKKNWSIAAIDDALLKLRRQLESEHGEDIDFYQEEFKTQWKNGKKNWLLSWHQAEWNWDTLTTDRAATIRGDKADTQWRFSSSQPREGDRVFLIRIGSPPKGIVAVGKITRAPYEEEHWEQARADADKTRLVDVAFDSVRDATKDVIVHLEDLQSSAPDQEWNPQSFGIEIKTKAVQTLERLWKALPPIVTGASPVDGNVASGAVSKKTTQPHNLILYGPPGTGKTYHLKNVLLPRYHDDEAGDRFEFVTFHQSYAYEDFIEGIRPITQNGTVTYEVRPGVLKRLCDRARRTPDKQFALFIDEINRGIVAKVFGELITPVEVDKRIRTDASGKRLIGELQWSRSDALLLRRAFWRARECRRDWHHEYRRPVYSSSRQRPTAPFSVRRYHAQARIAIFDQR